MPRTAGRVFVYPTVCCCTFVAPVDVPIAGPVAVTVPLAAPVAAPVQLLRSRCTGGVAAHLPPILAPVVAVTGAAAVPLTAEDTV